MTLFFWKVLRVEPKKVDHMLFSGKRSPLPNLQKKAKPWACGTKEKEDKLCRCLRDYNVADTIGDTLQLPVVCNSNG